jgi:DMSO/TMAO reductase YedYZ molybdopterin-dependent catalytic subunit
MHPRTLLTYEMNDEPLKELYVESHTIFGEGEGGYKRGP